MGLFRSHVANLKGACFESLQKIIAKCREDWTL